MDMSGRPLLDTKPDRGLFAGRDAELEQILTSIGRRLNVLLTGDRGSGKTTLLRQVAYELHQRFPDQPPAFVEGRLAEDIRVFLDLVRYRLGLSPALREDVPALAAVRVFRGKIAVEETLQVSNLVGSLAEAVTEGRRVVLVDELPVKSVGRALFGRLRDNLWQVPMSWIVAVSKDDAGSLLAPPADAFFDVVMDLQPLSREAQRAVLEARAGDEGRKIATQLDEGNPRRLLTLAREALEGNVDPTGMFRALSRRDAEVMKLGRSASMLMAELESLGPASASDERLLARLGWTRSRAVQVLRRLEDGGFVKSSTVKGELGRPRKVYQPVVPTVEGDLMQNKAQE